MNKTDYKKIEYYLYNYSNIDKLIDEIKDGLINSVNVSGSAWRKGITVCNNTLENQVIKIIENKKILEFKRWQVLIKKVLVFLLQKYLRHCLCFLFVSNKMFLPQFHAVIVHSKL